MTQETVDKPGSSTVERNDVDVIPEVDVTMEMVTGTAGDPESWLLYGGGHRNQRHALTEGLDRETVGDLSREWQINLSGQPAEYQGTPLIVPGDPPIMYQSNGTDQTRAINARTGDVLWHWSYEPATVVGGTAADRGVTVVGDTVYRSTLDLGVVALDRYTGDEKWYFNQAKNYRGEEAEGDVHEELQFVRFTGASSSFPPIPYDGKLLKGSFGGDYGVLGWIDAVTFEGESEWRFETIARDQWVGDSWRHGGATVWQPPAVDPETGIAVFPTGNPGPDMDGTVRPGWNKYSAGKLALDAESGEYLWDYQEVPHDWWDFDSPSPPFIFTADVNGEERKLVSWAGKTGWVFTADLETGQLVDRSEPVVQQFGLFDHPPKAEDNPPWTAPSSLGGTDPHPPAYDPATRTAVVKGVNIPMQMSWTDAEYTMGEAGVELYLGDHVWNFGRGDVDIDEWNGKPGFMAGVDPVTGELKWQHYYDVGNWGGAMTTDSGLTFAGLGDGRLVALDTDTGELLWEDDVGVGLEGDPITWYDPATEKQYVAIQGGGGGAVGGFGEKGDLLTVYSIDADPLNTRWGRIPEDGDSSN